MQLILTEQDARTLHAILRDYLPELARTHLSVCELSRRETLCERLLHDLNPGGSVAPAPQGGCGRKACRSAGGLSPAEVVDYRHRLEEAAARLGSQVTTLETEARQPTGSALGTTEEAAALALLHAEEGSLAEVAAALGRIDRGTYGRCETCGKPVSKARLDALPHARHCIGCARTAPEGG